MYSFDGLTLPNAESVQVNPGPAAIDYVRIAGGREWDARRSDRAPIQHVSIETDVWATGASAAGLRTTVDAILGKQGKQGTLIRVDSASSQHSLTARLSEVDIKYQAGNWNWIPASLRFESAEYPWRGTQVSTSFSATTGSNAFTVTNSGDYPYSAPTFTVTSAGTITNFTFLMGALGSTGAIWYWTWAGLTTAGGSLVVDCGAKTITNGGIAASSGFARMSQHNQNTWCEFSTGSNGCAIVVTRGTTANTPTVTYVTYDGWA